MYNKVTIIGRLGKDPELRYIPSGKPVCSFSVATDSGPATDRRTIWFRISAWEKLGELCQFYLAKGRLVYVEGTLAEPRIFKTKSGVDAVSLDVTASTVRFLSAKSAEPAKEDAEAKADADEEIPF
jgi:single-strand DNA-binding protein